MKSNLRSKIVGGLAGLLILGGTADALKRKNVLTASASDYAVSVERPLTDYVLVGLHTDSSCSDYTNVNGYCEICLIYNAPKGTEVITDYTKNTYPNALVACSGTALVRKAKPAKEAKPVVEEK